METISICIDPISVVRRESMARDRAEVFNPAWLRALVRTEPSSAYRIEFAEGSCRTSIGEVLSPDERLALAEALRTLLGAAHVDMSADRPMLHDFDAADYV